MLWGRSLADVHYIVVELWTDESTDCMSYTKQANRLCVSALRYSIDVL